MKRLIASIIAPLLLVGALGGCSFIQERPSPADITNSTVADEKVSLGVETAYKGWVALVETGVDLGLIKGETAAKVQVYDTKIYAAVGLARKAHDAGNAASYEQAAAQVMQLVIEGTALIKGGSQ